MAAVAVRAVPYLMRAKKASKMAKMAKMSKMYKGAPKQKKSIFDSFFGSKKNYAVDTFSINTYDSTPPMYQYKKSKSIGIVGFMGSLFMGFSLAGLLINSGALILKDSMSKYNIILITSIILILLGIIFFIAKKRKFGVAFFVAGIMLLIHYFKPWIYNSNAIMGTILFIFLFIISAILMRF
jgi:hypothetical protein